METAQQPGDLVWLFAEAWNRNDASALAALFAEDADFVDGTGLWWRSRRAIERAHDDALAHRFRDASLAVEQVAERRLSPGHAVVHCLWRLVGEDPPGARARRGILVLVAERRPAGWIAVTAQTTDIVPGDGATRG